MAHGAAAQKTPMNRHTTRRHMYPSSWQMRRSVDQRSLPSELGATTVPEHCQTRKTGPIGSANSKTPFAGAADVTMEYGCVTNGLANGPGTNCWQVSRPPTTP